MTTQTIPGSASSWRITSSRSCAPSHSTGMILELLGDAADHAGQPADEQDDGFHARLLYATDSQRGRRSRCVSTSSASSGPPDCDDPAVGHDVHDVRGDVVEQPLVVGDDEERRGPARAAR